MRYRSYLRNGAAGLAVHDGAVWRDLGAVDLAALIAAGRASDRSVADGAPEMDIDTVDPAPPISKPGKVICVGLNYVDHAKESPYKDLPTYPAFFPRFASSLLGAGQPILRPFVSDELDFEGELLVVIGRPARHVSAEEALSFVAGYSVFNDASIRNYQFLGAQWTPGKNFDATGACGPDFVTADELPPGGAGLRMEVRLNGEIVQSVDTSLMIFPVAELVAKASAFTTLEPGDMIATGTPAGVGFARKPPLYMKDGDVVEVTIEGIGTLVNPVRDEPRVPLPAAAE
ncbi:MAG: 5-oxopent-3-ene-1,2,5-tricarboxylate decarboxylase [Rhodovulum sulfidophilum]|uniref:5-oxopent-3-ene-1,2,5-tricarboxylate decarboxylase n=1 Tax=Rhodovulum sulfidophilum TaxID=35806 RepID=A0A2W5MYM2_RHOSU|nr:MAG: 5-oxopent-3-ene-1,2,5-tricarboxylate decarboxylase [Rhodovulum sulfidophilum]